MKMNAIFGDKVEVIILCGGYSSRMGFPKPFLEIDNNLLVQHISNVYRNFGVKNPIIVLNKELYSDNWMNNINALSLNNCLVKNEFPDLGRSYSLEIGLKLLDKNVACFIQNIDNPDISVELLRNMFQELESDNFVVACNTGIGGHPILVGKEIINHLKQMNGSEWILKDELKRFSKVKVEASSNNVLLNLNTQEEWKSYLNKKS